MALKNEPAGDGIEAEVLRQFKAGLLKISVASAVSKVGRCPKYGRRGELCGLKCKQIQEKGGTLRATVGLYIACEVLRDPLSHPGVHLDPELALQGFLLDRGSPLVVNQLFEHEKALVFRFDEQPISDVVKMIACQKFVNIDVGGGVERRLNYSDEVEKPSYVLHGVKQNSMQASLDILVNGFNYGEDCQPFGIYSVDATNEQQSGKIRYYDGGVSIVLKPTGFIVNMSKRSSNRKKRENPNDWITGAIPGVVLFRRMSSLREFIMHRDSVQFAYVSIEREIFEPWAFEFAVANPDAMTKAVEWRRERNATAGVVLPSGPEPSGRVDTAQIRASSEFIPDALEVAQLRLRSRSRSPTASEVRPEIGGGVEIPQPSVFLAKMLVSSGLSQRAAKTPDAGMSQIWMQYDDIKTFRLPDGATDPGQEPVFVPSTLVYKHAECEALREGAAALSAAQRKRKKEPEAMAMEEAQDQCDGPKCYTRIIPEEPEKKWYYCDGPGCYKRMSGMEDEWHEDTGPWCCYDDHYYCRRCYEANNFLEESCSFKWFSRCSFK